MSAIRTAPTASALLLAVVAPELIADQMKPKDADEQLAADMTVKQAAPEPLPPTLTDNQVRQLAKRYVNQQPVTPTEETRLSSLEKELAKTKVGFDNIVLDLERLKGQAEKYVRNGNKKGAEKATKNLRTRYSHLQAADRKVIFLQKEINQLKQEKEAATQ